LTHDRIRLYNLWQQHPQWPKRQLAEVLGYSLSWVKKWLRRFRETQVHDLALFRSRSRAPKNPARKVTDQVRNAILRLRSELAAIYGRVVGPKTIVYHLQQEPTLVDEAIPTSTATIWRVLQAAFPTSTCVSVPINLPEAMHEWEFDFGEVHLARDAHFEFVPIIDRGSSILIAVDSNGRIHVDNHSFQVGRQYAGCKATLQLDAANKLLHIIVAGHQVNEMPIPRLHERLMPFDEYAELMIKEARALARQLEDQRRAKHKLGC
jgi:hypothetical protein